MEEKYFVTNKKKNMPLPVIIVIVALITGVITSAITCYIFKSKLGITKISDSSSSGIKYEIQQVDNPVVAIAKNVGPSVVDVKVKSTSQSMFGLLQNSDSEGSGIIYSDDGYIITNYHVISNAINNSTAKITVILPNTSDEIDARIVGYDKVTDLAVLKIEKTGLQKATFGKSSDVEVGELAVAIGNPLGENFASTVTVGYISAVNRKITTDGRTYNLLQTDAAINPGNSGGALVNSKGEVIGINSVKVAEEGVEGMGFAIPTDDAIPIIDQLIKNKKISRPYIGVAGFDLDADTAKQYSLVEGVYVSEVQNGSPAQQAGIQKGDIITQIDGKDAKTMDELNSYKNTKNVGDKVTLKVYRQSKYVDIQLTLTEDTTTD